MATNKRNPRKKVSKKTAPVTIPGRLEITGPLPVSGEVVSNAARQVWQYLVRDQTVLTNANLNALGNDGWELVGGLFSGAPGTIIIFKRPLP